MANKSAKHVPTPILRCESPSPTIAPSLALGAPDVSGLSRCLSTGSTGSNGSATTEASHSTMRESLGSDMSAASRNSSASYPGLKRSVSGGSTSSSRRRGYMRPTGTDFAASARSRGSVLSLGSIAHLQYYFARTGLLEGKGGQLARKRPKNQDAPLSMSVLDSGSFGSRLAAGDADSSYASMGTSPEPTVPAGNLGGGPVDEQPDDEFYSDDYSDDEQHMLPPTVSTYNHREKPVPKPPSVAELKADLRRALDEAARIMDDARSHPDSPAPSSPVPSWPAPRQGHAAAADSPQPKKSHQAGWHEIQGMQILDVVTLAIRAAKMYYTAHEQPDRLDAIKTEKQLRSELLAVMELLKRMATRTFAGGLRPDEAALMDGWILSLRDMLATEDAMERAEAAEREGWTWLRDEGWEGRELEREHAFLETLLAGGSGVVNSGWLTRGAAGCLTPHSPVGHSFDQQAQLPPSTTSSAPTTPTTPTTPTPPTLSAPLPAWTALDRSDPHPAPTPFLAALATGTRLVHLHNCAVRRSRRRFGAIPSWHTDTQKPYRAADNLRYWVKAAELRWEVHLRLDALAVVHAAEEEEQESAAGTAWAWAEFEDAIRTWCRRVREEIAAEVGGS